MKKPALIAVISLGIAVVLFLFGIFVGRATAVSFPNLSPAPVTADTRATADKQKLNINTADAWQLQQLPGIGEVLAQNIIDYRNAHGSFSSLHQLLDVDGIGTVKLNNILELICLED